MRAGARNTYKHVKIFSCSQSALIVIFCLRPRHLGRSWAVLASPFPLRFSFLGCRPRRWCLPLSSGAEPGDLCCTPVSRTPAEHGGFCPYIRSSPAICHWTLPTTRYWDLHLSQYSHSAGLFSNQIKYLPIRREKKKNYSGYWHKHFSYNSCALRSVQWNTSANTALKIKERAFFSGCK